MNAIGLILQHPVAACFILIAFGVMVAIVIEAFRTNYDNKS